MGDLWGADLDELQELHRVLQRSADRTAHIERLASGDIAGLQATWSGRDSHEFEQLWRTTHRRALRSAASAMSLAAETIARNREAQEETSGTVDGPATPAMGITAAPALTLLASHQGVEVPTGSGPPSETADRVNELLSYGFFDWNVSGNEQREALDLLLGSDDLPAVIAELERRGDLETVIGRIDSPDLRLQLLRALGRELDADTRAMVLPHVREAGTGAEIQFHLGELGLPITNAEFDRGPYDDLISDDPGDPFTGVGATGVNPQEEGVGLIDSIGLGLGLDGVEAKYANPIGPLRGYLDGLSVDERHAQVELLVNQPISSDPSDLIVTPHSAAVLPGVADSYAGHVPTRRQIIELAAERYDLEPELITAVILAEQRDQSALEDAKDYEAAVSILEGNTSIGLGQVVVSTSQDNDLFADLLSEETRSDLSDSQAAELLSSDEVNIFATARYIRQVADQGATLSPQTIDQGFVRAYPDLDPGAYAGHSSTWPPGNIKALGSEYTSAPWDDGVFTGWGDFVNEAYGDVHGSGVYE